MTDLIDISGNALIFRRPDGSELLNTNDRQPAIDGSALFTGEMTWANPSGAEIEARIAGGGFEFRYKYPAGSRSYIVDLGAAPVGYTPNFLMSNIYMERQQTTDIFGFVYAAKQVRHAQWRAMNMGSLWVEYIRTSSANDAPIAHRHFSVAIEAGRWVLKLEETSRSYASSWGGGLSGSGDATASYDFSLNMAWGTFDL